MNKLSALLGAQEIIHKGMQTWLFSVLQTREKRTIILPTLFRQLIKTKPHDKKKQQRKGHEESFNLHMYDESKHKRMKNALSKRKLDKKVFHNFKCITKK